MNRNALGLFVWAAAYIGFFCYVYVTYLSPIYGFGRYPVIDRTSAEFAVSLSLAIVPILFYGFSRTVGAVLTAVIYVIYFVPSILIVHYSLARPWSEIFALQGSLTVTMCALFLAGRYPAQSLEKQAISDVRLDVVFLVSIGMAFVLVVVFRDHMRLVSFEDVYDLRSETNAVEKNFLINYFVSLLQYCLVPLIMAWGIVGRRARVLVVGVGISLILYMSTGSKTAILTPGIMLAFFMLMRGRGDLLKNILRSMTVLSVLVVVAVPDTDDALLKAVFFGRLLAASGYATNAYYDFFSTHAQTHLAQIGIVNGITGSYPYGSLQLGQIFGVEEAYQSINAGFWASEGIASFGLIGIYFASALMASYIIVLNWLARRFDWRLVGLWVCGLAIGVCNLPFFTLMLTGGGGLFLLLLFWFGLRSKRPEPVASVESSSGSPLGA